MTKFKESASYQLGKKGTLIVIDYPEENRHIIGPFIKKLSQISFEGRLRILFLTRQSFQEWDDFFGQHSARDLLDSVPIRLKPLDLHAAHELFSSVLLRLSKKLGTEPVGLTYEVLEAWLDEADENNRPLFLLALAVHSAYNSDDNVVRFSSYEVVDALVQRERDRLSNASSQIWGEENSHVFERILAVVAIAGKLPLSNINAFYDSGISELFPDKQRLLHELIRSDITVHDGTIEAPTPDILAALLTVNVFNDINVSSLEMVPELIWHALTVNPECVIKRFSRICYDVENTLKQKHHLGDWLLASVRDHEERCDIFHDLCVEQEVPMSCLNTAIHVCRVLLASADDEEIKAGYLNNLSVFLDAVGDTQGALESIKD